MEETGDLKYYPPGKRSKILSVTYDFCFRVATQTADRCGIYSGPWYVNQCEPQMERTPTQLGIEYWNAFYHELADTFQNFLPFTWTAYDLWQRESSGIFPGILGRVDVNLFKGTVRDLFKYAGLEIPVPPTPPPPEDLPVEVIVEALERWAGTKGYVREEWRP